MALAVTDKKLSADPTGLHEFPLEIVDGSVPSEPTRKSNLASVVFRLLRVKQWTKNLLVFAALIFSFAFKDPHAILLSLEAFLAMSFISSSTYIVNDLRDVEKDRRHPKKRLRPIASGEVSVPVARVTAVVVFIAGAALGFHLGKVDAAILGCYLLIQVAYNAGLKKTPVADVYAIALGFVLRAVLGAAAIEVTISGWLLFCTGALALTLGFGKRRAEFISQGDSRASTRDSLVHYNRPALDALVVMFACASALCYGVYTLQSETATRFPSLIITSPFVFYGITRYVLLVLTGDEGGEPEDMLFRDRHIAACIVLFLLAAGVVVSGFKLPFLVR